MRATLLGLWSVLRARAVGRLARRFPPPPPYAYVQVQGLATVTEDTGELVASATLIGRRYMGAERAEEFGRRNAVPGELLVKLRPTKVVTDLNVTG